MKCFGVTVTVTVTLSLFLFWWSVMMLHHSWWVVMVTNDGGSHTKVPPPAPSTLSQYKVRLLLLDVFFSCFFYIILSLLFLDDGYLIAWCPMVETFWKQINFNRAQNIVNKNLIKQNKNYLRQQHVKCALYMFNANSCYENFGPTVWSLALGRDLRKPGCGLLRAGVM